MKRTNLILTFIAFFAGVLLSIQANAQSNGQGKARLFAPAADETTVADGVQAVRINFGLLRSGRLQLDLGDGLNVDGVRDRDLAMGSGRRAWIGHVNGSSGDRIIFGQSGDALAGIINVGDRKFELFYIAKGLHGIREIGSAEPMPEATPILVAPSSGDGSGEGGSAGEPVSAGDGNTVVDVLVGYTAAARAAWGGTSGIESRIVTAVAETNDSYANSSVPITIQLAHAMEVIGDENGNSGVDLPAIRSTTDGKWDEIHGARTTYGADMVVLITEMTDACGRAYVMTSLSDSFKSHAFSVVDSGCAVGYYSFGHEMGHNQGSNHDPDNGGSRLYTFSQGHQDPDNVFRTVMAYNCPGGCTRRQYFSNPNVNYPANNAPTGLANLSDNAQSLALSAPTVAGWYSADPQIIPEAPIALSANATSASTIALAWTDQSDNESQFHIERSADGFNFTEVATTNANIATYDDDGLTADTLYFYRVSASNSAGTSATTNIVSTTTDSAPTFVDQYALSEQSVRGNVSGTYSNLQADDGSIQRISESHSGGKPRNRYTWLEHRWNFSIAAGNAITLHLVAETSAIGAEAMQFAYSTDNTNWTDLIALQDTSDANIVVPLPSNLSGSVFLRVADIHRVSGVQTGHWVEIDQLMIRSENDGGGTIPERPTDLIVSGVTSSAVSLNWAHPSNDETGFELERRSGGAAYSMVAIMPAGSSSFTDTGLAAETSYDYRLRAINGAGPSGYSNEVAATTGVAVDIALSVTATKQKGVQHAILSWSGAASAFVDIVRDGVVVANVSSGASPYDDNIGQKGGGSYWYQVCQAGSTTECSDPVQASF